MRLFSLIASPNIFSKDAKEVTFVYPSRESLRASFLICYVNQPITELLSITDIVKDRLFKISDYQRGYSWEEEQLNDLKKDIERISTIDHKHFIGTMVMFEAEEMKMTEVYFMK